MGRIREAMARMVGGNDVRVALEVARAAEAWSPLQGPGGSLDDDDYRYRRLSGDVDRSLPDYTQDRVAEIVFYLWKSNPLARRIIEVGVDYVVGDGLTIRAADPAVQAVIDTFTDDPVNAFYRKIRDKVRFLTLFGEQVYPVAVNEANGRVRLGYLDPALIQSVRLDSDNVEIIDSVVMRTADGEGRALSHVKLNDATGLREGECFYWSINRPPNAERGTSDLLACVDWLDALDQFYLSTIDRVQLQNMLVWDVEVQGADSKLLADYMSRVGGLKPGSIRAHNEKTKWSALTPEIDGRDIAEIGKMLKVWIGVAAGLPPHWIGEAGDSNRATAAEMGIPVTRSLKSRQEEIRWMIRELIEFVIDRAIAAGTLSAGVDRTFDVMMSTISVVDADKVCGALQKLTATLGDASAQGWIDDAKAGEVYRFLLQQIGVDLNPGNDRIDAINAAEALSAEARALLSDIA